MAIWVGTSGYNYPEWRGTFYPDKFPTAKMLPYYAERFATVEINYTFYRTPNAKILAGWSEATPARFKLTLKAPKRITHTARLENCTELLQYFVRTAQTLGPKLGTLFFQLPPYFKKDLGVLGAFLEELPADVQSAFEFRHRSWLEDDVYECLKAKGVALCVAESEKLSTPVQITANYAYFRLRDQGYTPSDLGRWADTIRAKTGACRDVYVYFKHEESGTGPAFARTLLDALEPG
ncbi:MAG TPA: DUF72 domain-containing protein [Steroidobacteraceae bacterium]|nr:DUF72 domain-containing protein [Steroidobacteraceae bacterium]